MENVILNNDVSLVICYRENAYLVKSGAYSLNIKKLRLLEYVKTLIIISSDGHGARFMVV